MGNYKRGPGNYKTDYFYRAIQLEDITINNSTTLVETDLKTPSLKVGSNYVIWFTLGFVTSVIADIKFHYDMFLAQANYERWGFKFAPDTPIGTNIEPNGDASYQMKTGRVVLHDVTTAGVTQIQVAQKNLDATNTLFKKGSTMLVSEF